MLSPKFDQALQYATLIHAGQTRKGTEIPYLSHLLGMASIGDPQTPVASTQEGIPCTRVRGIGVRPFHFGLRQAAQRPERQSAERFKGVERHGEVAAIRSHLEGLGYGG